MPMVLTADEIEFIARFYTEFGFGKLADQEFVGVVKMDYTSGRTGFKTINLAFVSPRDRIRINEAMRGMEMEDK